MDITEALRARHSVRSYTDRPIEGETLQALETAIDSRSFCSRCMATGSPPERASES